MVKNKKESGVVVVEASIIVTLVMIIITAMLYVGMVLYQQTLVHVMATQTASNIAQVYSNNLKDPFTGYVDPARVYQTITYSNMRSDAYMDVIEQKANVFSKYRLKSSRILVNDNTSVEVDIVKKQNELLKSQIVVTIRDKYDIPLVGMFVADGLVEFAAQGRADCVDILEYINGVDAVGDPEESNVSFLPDSKNCTVTFIPDRTNPAGATSVTVLKGKSILTSNRYTHCVMPSNPTNGSYDFAGWADDRGRSFTASTVVEEDIVVYGAWKCTVTLDANGGTVNSRSVYSFYVIKGNRVSFPNASRSDNHFKGWYTGKDGQGVRYLSNDTVIDSDVTLYAYWACSHPSRRESRREGNVCTGGTIYYVCTRCGVDMGTGSYPGNGHSYRLRCNKKHYVFSFNGYGSGGCGYFHYKNSNISNRYNLKPYKHTSSNPWMYCQVCVYCHESRGYFWCGVHGGNRGSAAPVNGHQY